MKRLGIDVTIMIPGPVVTNVVQNAYTGTLDKVWNNPCILFIYVYVSVYMVGSARNSMAETVLGRVLHFG